MKLLKYVNNNMMFCDLSKILLSNNYNNLLFGGNYSNINEIIDEKLKNFNLNDENDLKIIANFLDENIK